MRTTESTTGFEFDAVSVTTVPVEGVPPPPPVPPPAGGAVGDSPLHDANRKRSASSAIHDFCCLIAFMSAPCRALGTLCAPKCLGAPSAAKAELEREHGRVGHVVPGERLAEDFQDYFELHHGTPGLR